MTPRRRVVGVTIRRRRKALDMTQADLAQRARLTQGYISQLESGRSKAPSLQVAQRLARALDMSLEELTS
jgi:transcriptional regulator with XRE-family HTH domain